MRHSRNIAGEAKKTLKKVSSLGSTVNARRNRRFLAWWQTQYEIFAKSKKNCRKNQSQKTTNFLSFKKTEKHRK